MTTFTVTESFVIDSWLSMSIVCVRMSTLRCVSKPNGMSQYSPGPRMPLILPSRNTTARWYW